MTQTPPVQERSTRFACPHPQGARFTPGEGHIVPRSWPGSHQHLERLRCTACERECSERAGTLLARRTRPAATVAQLLQCQRWGVCDVGTADICAVALKPVHRFQPVAAQRAETHQCQSGQPVEMPGVPVDEAHAPLRPKQVAWGQTALALGSWCLLGVDVGPRTQGTAAALLAQVIARPQPRPLFLTDGWQP